MPVSCECCVLSGRGLCDGPMTRPGESYGVWCVLSVIEGPHRGGLGTLGLSSHWGGGGKQKKILYIYVAMSYISTF
jgi:hypothetical protein